MNSGEDYYALGSEVAEISSWRKKRFLSEMASRGHHWRRQASGLQTSLLARIVGPRGLDGLSDEPGKAAFQSDQGVTDICTHLVWSRSSFCLLCSTTSVQEHTDRMKFFDRMSI
ncbi:MAG: hypothetical protein AUH28_08145 [Acidobacteria bacterium 13_1_40CM_56_16]|nr:MAG: hypothetical protein AUH28_08145 [Acidobacteria bacterium 13_1_40CM_56_16]